MKNNKIKIILSAIIFLSVVGFVTTVNAASSSLNIFPASLTKTVGNIFNVSMEVNASGNKICAVEGTLVFDNLSCQSITMADGVMAQSSPTCSNPHFLIGIPSCSTADKTLLTVSVKAGSTSTASVSFTGVDIIGEGVSVGSASTGGNYTINAVTSVPVETMKTVTEPVVVPEDIISTTTTSQSVEQVAENNIPPTSLLAAVGYSLSFGTGNILLGILVGLIILAALIYTIYTLIQKRKKKKELI